MDIFQTAISFEHQKNSMPSFNNVFIYIATFNKLKVLFSSSHLTAVWVVLMGAGSEMNGHCFLSSLSSMAFWDTETQMV